MRIRTFKFVKSERLTHRQYLKKSKDKTWLSNVKKTRVIPASLGGIGEISRWGGIKVIYKRKVLRWK